jgi:hypothetical protein
LGYCPLNLGYVWRLTMKLNFLCANHREWLEGRPDQALHWCVNSYDTGRSLSERDHWDEALVHMGCAFETGDCAYDGAGMVCADPRRADTSA